MSKLAPAQVLFSSLVLLLQLHAGSIAKLLGSAVHPCKHGLCKAKDTQIPLWAKAAMLLLSGAAVSQVTMRKLLQPAVSRCRTGTRLSVDIKQPPWLCMAKQEHHTCLLEHG